MSLAVAPCIGRFRLPTMIDTTCPFCQSQATPGQQPRDIAAAYRLAYRHAFFFPALRLRARKKTGKAGSSILPCNGRLRPGLRNMQIRPQATTRNPLRPRPPTDREPRLWIWTDCQQGRVPQRRYPTLHGERGDVGAGSALGTRTRRRRSSRAARPNQTPVSG